MWRPLHTPEFPRAGDVSAWARVWEPLLPLRAMRQNWRPSRSHRLRRRHARARDALCCESGLIDTISGLAGESASRSQTHGRQERSGKMREAAQEASLGFLRKEAQRHCWLRREEKLSGADAVAAVLKLEATGP